MRRATSRLPPDIMRRAHPLRVDISFINESPDDRAVWRTGNFTTDLNKVI
jgi:hypothetical protein